MKIQLTEQELAPIYAQDKVLLDLAQRIRRYNELEDARQAGVRKRLDEYIVELNRLIHERSELGRRIGLQKLHISNIRLELSRRKEPTLRLRVRVSARKRVLRKRENRKRNKEIARAAERDAMVAFRQKLGIPAGGLDPATLPG